MTDEELTPKEVGGFRILRRLASGATSDVLLARAEGPHGFQRVVALKILLARKQGNKEFESHFAAEASAYARLSNPAVVKLYDFFSADGQLVMVLEYVDGVPLHKLRAMLAISGERIEDKPALFLGMRVFTALAAAHGARDPARGGFAPIVHYDVNPSNILVPWDGQVKLGDFGIAKAAGIETDARAGFIKGTYGYSAPEQVSGKEVTLRADIYSAGLILWELLARRKAVQRGNLNDAQVLKAMAHPEFPALELLRPNLNPAVRTAVRRALEPNPEKRTLTAEEMVAVLAEAVSADEGRKALASAMTKVRAKVAGDTAASKTNPPEAGRGPRDGDSGSPPAPDDAADDKLDPEQTAPFAAVTDDAGDLGKIAFYGRIKLPGPGDSQAPPKVSASAPPAPVLTPPAPPVAAAPERTEPPPSPAHPSGPPRPVPRPAAEKKVSDFATIRAPPLEPETSAEATLREAETVPDPVVPAHATLPASEPAAGSAASEPSSPAAPPRTERSPEVSADSAAAPADGASPATPERGPAEVGSISAPPPAPVARNEPPYVQSSLPPPARRFPWVGAAVAGLLLAGGGTGLMLHSSDVPVASTTPVASVGPQLTSAAAPSAAPPAPSATESAVAAAPAPETSGAAIPSATLQPSAPPAVASAAPSQPSAPPPVAVVTPPTPASSSAAPSPSPATPEAADTGELDLPASAAQHRIFVDGKVAGEGTAPLHIHCGSHQVRIGSAGTEKKIDIPCGGTISF